MLVYLDLFTLYIVHFYLLPFQEGLDKILIMDVLFICVFIGILLNIKIFKPG